MVPLIAAREYFEVPAVAFLALLPHVLWRKVVSTFFALLPPATRLSVLAVACHVIQAGLVSGPHTVGQSSRGASPGPATNQDS